MIVLIVGNVVSGINLIGPFDNHEDACRQGEDSGMEWQIVEMTPPQASVDDEDDFNPGPDMDRDTAAWSIKAATAQYPDIAFGPEDFEDR